MRVVRPSAAVRVSVAGEATLTGLLHCLPPDPSSVGDLANSASYVRIVLVAGCLKASGRTGLG